MSGIELSPSRELFGIAIAASIANGLFDYRSALLRAQFLDRAYARLMLVKNVMAITLTVGAAFVTGSAVFRSRRRLHFHGGLGGSRVTRLAHRDGSVPRRTTQRRARLRALRDADRRRQRALCRHIADQPLPDDGLVRLRGNGYFSLANDLGGRLIGAVGTALDALLFQLAVKADERDGRHAAQEQVARNMTIVFAILTPAAVGFWLILPSIEALLAPPSFRGHFSEYLQVLLPGLYCQGMATYAINAVFQIKKTTNAIVAAAFVGFAVNGLLLMALTGSSHPSMIPIAQSIAYAAAFVCLVALSFAAGAKRPAFADLFLTCVGVAVMTLALLPMRDWTPGAATLLVQVCTGGGVMVACILLFNIANLRPVFLQAAKQVLRRRL